MTLVDSDTQSGTDATGLPGPDPFVQLAFVHQALDDLARADLQQLDDEWCAQLIASAGRLVARAEAVQAVAATEVERRGHDRHNGFFSTHAYIKHHGRLAGPTARCRTQTMRMHELLPDWAAAAHSGDVGADQTRLMARIAANPRLHEALVARSAELLHDAQWCSYDEFERRLRNFARLADPSGARTAAIRNHEARDVSMFQKSDGSWRIRGRFGSLQGAEINEILAHFTDAEFHIDWHAATADGSDEPSPITRLPRTEAHRRADALTAALLAAASAPGDGKAPLPALNVLIDETTLEETITGAAPDPARYRSMVCRTQSGHAVDTTEAASLALWAHIRRVVHDGHGVVTDLGRRSRTFRGAARDAALILRDRCIWPGCERPVRICQVDHAVSWMQRGATDPDNGPSMCGSHNRLKHRGDFTARRSHRGDWEIRNPDGDIIG